VWGEQRRAQKHALLGKSREGLRRSELSNGVTQKNDIGIASTSDGVHRACGQVYSLLRPPQDEIVGMDVPGEFRGSLSIAMVGSSACWMCVAMRLDASAEAMWNPVVLPEADIEAFNSVDGEGLSPAVYCLKQVPFGSAHADTLMFALMLALTECPLRPLSTGISILHTHVPTPAYSSSP
jgi:hypothetical protein